MTRSRPIRVPVRLPAVEIADTGDRVFHTKNISMGGIFLLSSTRWPVGTNLELAITFGQERVPAMARVTHLQADGAGFTFVKPSRVLLSHLRAVIESVLPDADRPEAPRDGHRVVWTQYDRRYEALLFDLSPAGGFLHTADPPDVEAELLVYLPAFLSTDAGLTPHELRGCAARVTGLHAKGFTVQFIGASAEFRMAVHAWLKATPVKPVKT